MPFGDFKDFQDCVDKNSDKSNPEAYCAWLHKRITGKWPTEKMGLTDGMPDGLKNLFMESVDAWMNDEKGEEYAVKRATEAAGAAGWTKRNGTWFRPKVDNQMHLITGVTIFKSGTYNGDSYSEADIDQMVSAYYILKGRVDCPLKLGHTSDDFNQKLAQKMGVLPELMQGENGKGAIALGWVENPRRYGDNLIADIAGVPSAIKELIENKRYANLSAEIMLGYEDGGKQYPKVLTGVALLGAELPAVPEADLEKVAIYTKSVAGKIVQLDKEDELEEEKELDNFWGEMKARLKSLFRKSDKKLEANNMDAPVKVDKKEQLNKEAEDVKELCTILGLAEDADKDTAIAAVKKLQEGATVREAETKEFSNARAKIAQLEKDNATLKAEADAEKNKARRAYFVSKAQAWQVISGKPEELADNLMKIEAVSPALAEQRMSEYEEENKRLMALGVTKPIGTSKEGPPADDEHPFVKEVKAKMAADTKKTEAIAFAEARQEHPLVFREYMKSRPRPVNKEA